MNNPQTLRQPRQEDLAPTTARPHVAPLVFFKKEKAAVTPGSELLAQGYERRTTAGEPRLSELIAQYREIGYDVEVVEFTATPDSCSVCFDVAIEAGQIYGDIYVRRVRME